MNSDSAAPTVPTTPTAAAIVNDDGAGELLEVRGTRILVKLSTPELAATDHLIPAGFPGPPLHVHPGFDELFVVLEGSLSMRLGEEVVELAPGGTALVPGATPHTFANTGAVPARFLVVLTPGGFEDYFRAAAVEDEAAIAAVSARFGYAPQPA